MILAQDTAFWVVVMVGSAPAVIGFGWAFIEHCLASRWIARSEIEGLAADLEARHPQQACQIACDEEVNAWLRCDAVEQGKWRQVRRLLEQRAGCV